MEERIDTVEDKVSILANKVDIIEEKLDLLRQVLLNNTDLAGVQQHKKGEIDRVETEHTREQQNRTEVHITGARNKEKKGMTRRREE